MNAQETLYETKAHERGQWLLDMDRTEGDVMRDPEGVEYILVHSEDEDSLVSYRRVNLPAGLQN